MENKNHTEEQEQKDFAQAGEDVLNLMQKWAKENLSIRPVLMSGLSVFIQAIMDLSPCKQDIMRVLGEAMLCASDNSARNREKENEVSREEEKPKMEE